MPRGAVAHGHRLRIDPNRALGSAVSGMAAGAADKAHDRADVDDRAAAGFRHLLGSELGAEDDAGLVHRDDPVPAVESIRIANRAAGNPGIVHQNVESPVGLHRLGDQRYPGGLAVWIPYRMDREGRTRNASAQELRANPAYPLRATPAQIAR